MTFNINRYKWILIVGLAIVMALIPILATVFELITSGKKSVVFLDGYPTSISVLALLFYILLIIFGLFWFIKQIILFTRLKNDKPKS
jgi:two-component system sensor histidine kinase AlgZ